MLIAQGRFEPPELYGCEWITIAHNELRYDSINGHIPWKTIREFAIMEDIEDEFDTLLNGIRVIENTIKEDSNGTTEKS